MQSILCPFCDIDNEEVAIVENGFTGKHCSKCSLIYISPRPTMEEIINLYGHGEAHQSADAHIASEVTNRLYAKHHLKTLKKYKRSGDLLEIGAAAGYFLDEAKKGGYNPVGIELDPVQASYIRDKLNIECEEKTLGEVYKDRTFDVVYHCDVISHFYDPIEEFRKINTAMDTDSILMFETGNFGDVDKSYYSEIPKFQYPDHLFFFSTVNIQQILEMTGFELLEIKRFSILPQLKIRQFLRLFKPGKKSTNPGQSGDQAKAPARQKKSKKPNLSLSVIRWLWSYFNYFSRYYLGAISPKEGRPQTMIIVARKK